MAQKRPMFTGDGKTMHLTVNTITVGKNGNNTRRADVQLVQFFLKKFYEHSAPARQMSGIKEIKIDGIAGNKTIAGIYWFQKYRSMNGSYLKVDSLVSIMTNFTGGSAITGTAYTIADLNIYFRNYGEGKEHSEHLENHPDIIQYAPELKSELAHWAFGV